MAAKNEVTFVIRARDLTRGAFRRIGRSVRGLRLGLGSLVAGFGLQRVTRDMLDFATSIDAASERLDVSAENLQALRIQAEDANVPFETLVTVVQRLASNAGAALNGTSDMAERFADLGLSISELRGMSGEDILLALADAAASAGDDVLQLRDRLRRVGDTEIIRLLPLLRRGSQAIQAETARLIRGGQVQSADAIRRQAETEASARRVLLAAQLRISQLLLAVLPKLDRLLNRTIESVQTAGAVAGGAVGTVGRADSATARAVSAEQQRFAMQPDSGVLGAVLLDLFRGGREALEDVRANTEKMANRGGATWRE